MEIKFEDYLSEDERKQIVANIFMAKCQQAFDKGAERIFTNAAYESVFKIMNQSHNGEVAEKIAEKTGKVIDGLSDYLVFRRKDAWEKDESEGYRALNAAIHAHKQRLSDKIASIIDELDESNIKEILIDEARELLDYKLFGKTKDTKQ